MRIRPLGRGEIDRIWEIDRRESHDRVYVMRDGELALVDHHFDVPGWHPQTVADDGPKLERIFDRGGVFLGAFDGEVIAGVVVLDGDRLEYLYVGAPYRGRGLGTTLFHAAVAHAPAGRIVISATRTENTIDFYLARGCMVDPSPDPAAVAAEPEDIHLVYAMTSTR
jgi:GNAT superfamily N-acetyltransferase